MVDFLIAMLLMAFGLVLFGAGAVVVWSVYLDRPSHLTPKQAWDQLLGQVRGSVTPYVPGRKDKAQPAGPPDGPPQA